MDSVRLGVRLTPTGHGFFMEEKFVKKGARARFENGPTCVAYEYPMHDKEIDVAYVEINGRYPEKDRIMNELVKELGYVVVGKGKVVIEGREYSLGKGDEILIMPKQRYYWDGKLGLLMSCTPAWYPEQHKMILD